MACTRVDSQNEEIAALKKELADVKEKHKEEMKKFKKDLAELVS
jgi:hypothetical protein